MRQPYSLRPRLWSVLGLLVLPTLVPCTNASAAQDDPQLVDRIVAIVGDTVVTQTEVQEYLFRLQAQGMQLPTDPAQQQELLRQALEQKINELVVVLKAREAGITARTEEINDAVEQRLAAIRRNFRSEQEFEQALEMARLTPAEFRLQLTEQTRAELLGQQYLQQHLAELRPTPVGDEEIRERFEQQKEALGPKPPSVTLEQVVITPRASESARLSAREEAEEALSRLRSGEEFARIAREYSDDPGTRDKGGELGWVRRGQLVAEFEEALFALRADQLSDIVETPFGLHIIKLERTRGAERFARHILVQPEITEEDIALARTLAEEVATTLRAGADIDSLVRAYGDPQERSELTNYPIDRLPEEYQRVLNDASAGDVVGPFRIPAPGTPGERWVVAQVTSMDAGGEWTLADVRDGLRRQIQQEKMIRQLIDRLREATYIDVRI